MRYGPAPPSPEPHRMPDVYSLSAMICMTVVPATALRVDPSTPRLLRTMAPVLGLTAAMAALVPRGPESAAIACAFLVFAIWNLAWGAGRFLASPEPRAPETWAAAVGAVGPVVAAIAWVWARWNGTFAGFPEPLASLTVAHFTVTFGLLPMAAAGWTRGLRGRRGDTRRQWGLWGITFVPASTGLFFSLRDSPMVPSALEVGLTWAMVLAFAVWWSGLRADPSGAQRQGRIVRIAADVLLVGFAFGALYAGAQRFGYPWLHFPGMLATHGVANLFAALTLAVLAPTLMPVATTAPEPDPSVSLEPGDPAKAIFTDEHHVLLGLDSPEGWTAATTTLLQYRVYPPRVMHRTAAFDAPLRRPRVGDRIGLGLRLPSLPGLPGVVLPSMVEVHTIEDNDEHAIFGYTTTAMHYGRGVWRAQLNRRDGHVWLRIESHIRPARWFGWVGLPLYRVFQQRAVRGAVETLKSAVATGQAPPTPPMR